jgi:sugar diacid utilization regulator
MVSINLLLRFLRATPEKRAAIEQILDDSEDGDPREGTVGAGAGEGAGRNLKETREVQEILTAIDRRMDRIETGVHEMKQDKDRLQETLEELKLSKGVARKAFALVKQLDSKRPLQTAPLLAVFRLYCRENKSADEVAKQCHCAKGTIINRLRMIEKWTGKKVGALRAYSPYFDQIEERLSDPRAKRINRRRAIDGEDAPGEGING